MSPSPPDDQAGIYPSLQLKLGEPTNVYIDGANLFNSSRLLSFDIDYGKLRYLIDRQCNLWHMYYYTAVGQSSEETPVINLVSWMDYNDYHTITKPLKITYNRDRIKGNMDVELAIDMLRDAYTNKVRQMILFSGDGDFKSLVAELQRLGTRVLIISTVKTRPPSCADELIRQADHFVDLDLIKSSVLRERPNNGKI